MSCLSPSLRFSPVQICKITPPPEIRPLAKKQTKPPVGGGMGGGCGGGGVCVCIFFFSVRRCGCDSAGRYAFSIHPRFISIAEDRLRCASLALPSLSGALSLALSLSPYMTLCFLPPPLYPHSCIQATLFFPSLHAGAGVFGGLQSPWRGRVGNFMGRTNAGRSLALTLKSR